MGKWVAAALTIAGAVIWCQRNSPGFGEWLRRMSDGPTNLVLIGTSGFEREGRDPAKPR
ncbi:MAG: hypothetical protein U0031_13685 [Thermomicrobiales bacterium]